ncbi:hypothetical protein [Bifidobacterium callitrichidarum]|uniref:Uncharacterized protein n=1 Tax=Bifidobacterium callitrichidarum TaxID=2052941 RepID=A0A2U2NCB0_9BIFI|nr:hypothetical protein [Bifidobacterium callitrichidarum]PWG66743.1 hypothetical protein DF196_02235 [Bifidobacterium callitrichidarum]
MDSLSELRRIFVTGYIDTYGGGKSHALEVFDRLITDHDATIGEQAAELAFKDLADLQEQSASAVVV